jgi:hypothetical protein
MTNRTLTPFPVDPDVLSRIRGLGPEDVGAVARLHCAAMGNSLWAQLGEGFLRTLYAGLVRHPDFRGFVYEDEGRVRGFIAGSNHGRRMFRQVLLRRAPGLVAAAVPGLLRRPALLAHLLQTASYFRRADAGIGDDVVAESMFCSFEPELRGLRVSGLINKVLFDELAGMGHRSLKITTEVANLGAVRQLTSWGFERLGEFDFYGKRMLVWRLDLVNNERVEPVRRHPARGGEGPR